MEALNINKVDLSAHAAVIEDTKYPLKLWFSYYEINVCCRSANSVFHALARLDRMLEPNWNGEADVPALVAALCFG